MSNVHDFCGFEFNNAGMDGITVAGGGYSTTSNPVYLPIDSRSSRSLNHRGDTLERAMPLGTVTGPEYWIVMKVMRLVSSCDVNALWGVYNSGAAARTDGIGISFDNGTLELELKVAGSVVGTSSGARYGIGAWHNIYVHVNTHAAAGTVTVHMDSPNNAALITYALTGGDITTLTGLPDSWVLNEPGTISFYVDDILLLDMGAAGSVTIDQVGNPSMTFLNATADEDHQDQSSGTYNDINDRPYNATPIVLDNSGDQTSHTLGDADATDFGAAYGLRMSAFVVSDGSAGANCELGIRDGSANEITQSFAAPASDNVEYIFLTAADAGSWTSAKISDTQQVFGAVA